MKLVTITKVLFTAFVEVKTIVNDQFGDIFAVSILYPNSTHPSNNFELVAIATETEVRI